jgi:hypothetical protein
MNKNDLKDALVQVINDNNGGKGVEIVALFVTRVSHQTLKASDVADFLNELVQERRIMEFEYSLPSDPYRLKSFYLPADTEFNYVDPQTEKPIKPSQVPIWCCDGFKSNLNPSCDQHGWNCPDHLMYLKEVDGKTSVCIPSDHDNGGIGVNWTISHCPFCGKEILFGEAIEL